MRRKISVFLTLAILTALPVFADENPKANVEIKPGIGGCQGDCNGIDPSLGAEIGGYFFIQKEIGVGGNFRFQHYGTDAGSMNSYMIGPELKYFIPVDPKFKIYVGGGFGFDMLKFEVDTGFSSASGDDNAIYVRAQAGGSYQINKELGIGLGFSYQLNFWKDSNGTFNDYFIALSANYNIY